MNKLFWITLPPALLVCLNALRAEEAKRTGFLQTAERIRSEERRQVEVNRRIGAAVGKLDALLEGLKANGLYEEGKGKVRQELIDGLVKVSGERVPEAQHHLQTARGIVKAEELGAAASPGAPKGGAYQPLNNADKEITAIVQDIDHLLKSAETSLIVDVLLERIRFIIKTQSFLHRETREWGKKLFILGPDVAAADQTRVLRAQNEVLEELKVFTRLLEGAAENATDASLSRRFDNALEILDERKPDSILRSVLTNVRLSANLDDSGTAEEDPPVVRAARGQESAVEILKEVERVLAEDENEIASKEDVLEELKRILADQVELKEEVEEDGKELPNASDLQADQLDLNKDLDDALAGEPPSDAVNEASDAMDAAADALGDDSFDDTLASQETAINALQDAISQLEADIAAAAAAAAADPGFADSFSDPPLDSFADPMDSFADDSFADAFPADTFGDSFSDGFPADSGFPSDGGFPSEGAGAPAPGAGAPAPGAGAPAPGQGAPGIGPPSSVPGQGTPVPGSFAPAPPGVLPDDPAIDSTGYSSTTVKVNHVVKRTAMSIQTLERRRRATAIQKYVQQLPPEFRQQVADYYEVLAE